MKRVQYNWVSTAPDDGNGTLPLFIARLDALAEDGWELCGFHLGYAWFKREAVADQSADEAFPVDDALSADEPLHGT